MSDPLDGVGDAHRALSHIYENYGLAGLDDEALLARMLPDLMPARSREARLLIAAASVRVGQQLTNRVAMNIPPDTAVRDVAELLVDQAALDAAAGTWAVNQYATVLGYRVSPARLPSARATASVPVAVPVPGRAPASAPIYESTRTMTDTSGEGGEAPETEAPAPAKKPKRKGSFWRELPILLGAAIVVALLVRTFVVQTFYVPSDSMEHTLNVNDRVLVNKLVYDFREPRRGEVIVFTAPQDWRQNPDETDFVKRVIGTPGDHVVCCSGNQLVINGVPLDEPYIHLDRPDSDKASPEPFDIVVPAGRLWVMGDNRDNSADSRYHWVINKGDINDATIPISSVIGRAFVLFWPLGRATWLNVPDGYSKIPDHP